MKRALSLFIVLSILSGCTQTQSLNQGFVQGLSKPIAKSTNHKKNLMHYYLPPIAGVKKSGQNYSIITLEGYDILMNLKIDNIVSEKFDYDKKEEIKAQLEPKFTDEATYIDIKNQTKTMNVRVYEIEDRFAIFLSNSEVNMVSIVPQTNIAITLESMVDILKTVVVNKEEVVSAYSNKEISTYDSTYAEFFEQVPPETGSLKDMYDQLNPDKQPKE